MTEKHYLQVELEELLKSDSLMWTFLQEGSLDGVWYWDLERPDQEWMSPQMWQLFGVDPATRRHDPAEWQDLINPDDLAVALDNFQKHCADPNHPYDQVVRYRHADGSTVWVRCRGIALRNSEGKPIRMLGAHNDLTAVKLAEEQIWADKLAIENINGELQAFAYSISHDMKAPANTIAMILSELRFHLEDQCDEEGLSMIDDGLRATVRMRALIDDVLDYTTIVGDPPVMAPVDLNQCIDEVLLDIRSDIERSSASVEVSALPTVNAVASQMRLLFQNLICNAIKFQEPGATPKIWVSSETDRASGESVITVADNGIGISAEYQARIFKMFERLHLKKQYEGTGLGLALCKRIALSHGGRISVDSTPGEGARFQVRLPNKKG